jgi:hypothetical protein
LDCIAEIAGNPALMAVFLVIQTSINHAYDAIPQ